MQDRVKAFYSKYFIRVVARQGNEYVLYRDSPSGWRAEEGPLASSVSSGKIIWESFGSRVKNIRYYILLSCVFCFIYISRLAALNGHETVAPNPAHRSTSVHKNQTHRSVSLTHHGAVSLASCGVCCLYGTSSFAKIFASQGT